VNLKKIGKVFTSKFVGTGPSSYKKRSIYRAAVSQSLRNTALLYSLYTSRNFKIPLCYKPVGRGFDSRWFLWSLSLAVLPAALRPCGWLSL